MFGRKKKVIQDSESRDTSMPTIIFRVFGFVCMKTLTAPNRKQYKIKNITLMLSSFFHEYLFPKK